MCEANAGASEIHFKLATMLRLAPGSMPTPCQGKNARIDPESDMERRFKFDLGKLSLAFRVKGRQA